MLRRRTTLAVRVLLGTALFAGTVLGGSGQQRHDFTEALQTATQNEYVIVTFQDPPAARYTGGIAGLARTKPESGKFDSNSPAAQAYLKHLQNVHNNYRSWLAREGRAASIVREYSIALNGFAIRRNGVASARLAAGPGVRSVSASWLYQPTMNVSAALIRAEQVWAAAGGRANAGGGINVGIIDSGIDERHPFFDCKTTITHKVYASGVAFNPSNLLVSDHGTHVAGTVAGCVTAGASSGGATLSGTISGVAPGAGLHDYNVFPGFGAGFVAFDGSAFSHDIAAALEDTVRDGMDVVNMSLGGRVQGPHDLLAEAVNATVEAGLVVAVAAGNEGPGAFTVSSPGSAFNALTAGASTNPHFVGISVTAGSATVGAALGDFNNFAPPVTTDYTVTTPADGCAAISTPLSGKIAVIDRGVCTFTTKIRNAQAAGAIGVLIVNNVAGDPIAMAHDGTNPFPTISAAMLGKNEGNALKPSGSVTVDGTSPLEFLTAYADIIAGFSSRGPTPFTYLIKPDVTAPGVNIASSVFDGEWAFFQGTSMATPHLAGAAALLLGLHPDWSPADVKSALVNTAVRTITDHVNGTADPGVLARGGGRVDLVAADSTPLHIEPASVSFGFWNGNATVSASTELAIRSTGTARSCSVTVTGPGIVTASAGTITVTAGGRTTLTLKLAGGQASRTRSGNYNGDVVLKCAQRTLQVPWFTLINREAKP